MSDSEEIVRTVIEEIGDTCFLLIGRAGTGKSFIASKVAIDLCDEEKHGAGVVTRVFIVTCAYQQGIALKAQLSDVSADVVATSLHNFMGVIPGDNERAQKSVYLEELVSQASYYQLNEVDTVQLVILEEFFYSPMAVHALLYLATRPRTYVIACGDPGQIGRDIILKGGQSCHVSRYIYEYVLVPHVCKQVSMIVLANASYRQSSELLRGLSDYMERNNRLPYEMQHNFAEYVAGVVPDDQIVATIAEWVRGGMPFYFVGHRASVNTTCSAVVSATGTGDAFRSQIGSRIVYLTTRSGWYETSVSIPYKVEGEPHPRYIPNGTPVTVVSMSGTKAVIRVAGHDNEFCVVFSDQPKSDPIRPVRFKSYDLIQGETINFNVLFHSTAPMSPGSIYVAMTRAIDVSFFYCSTSFKKMMIDTAMSQDLINHKHANTLYDMVN